MHRPILLLFALYVECALRFFMYKNQCRRNSGRSIPCKRKSVYLYLRHIHTPVTLLRNELVTAKKPKPHLKNYSYLLTTACVSTQIPSFCNELPIKLHCKNKSGKSHKFAENPNNLTSSPPLRNFPTTPRHSRNKLNAV